MKDEDITAAHKAAMAEVSSLNKDGVSIHNKKYTTVATRIEVFRKHFGPSGRLRITEAQIDAECVRMAAVVEVLNSGGWVEVSQGRAEEYRDASAINRTSAVEVCETSAYGRALAQFGLHGGEFASANEVEHAIKKREYTTPAVEEYPIDKAREMATEIRGLMESDTDETVMALKAMDLREKLTKAHTMEGYIAGCFQLSKDEQKSWKLLVAAGQKASVKPMNATGRG